ncbi:MAG: polymerase subunit beta [Acidimicrobiaceae bacterium]|jgi:DNA polymerase-3 subunit beta
MPVLSGIRAELKGGALQLTGSDSDLTIHVSVTVNGEEDGVTVLPGRLAGEIVRALPPGAVVVVVDDEEAHITSGRSEFAIRVLPAEEYPRLSDVAGDPLTLSAGELADALRQVVPAASSDDARPILTGVLLAAEAGGLRLVATDSYRLSVRDLPGTSVLAEGQHVLVPSRALEELGRMLPGVETVELRLGERDASFSVGETRLTTRLIEGEFPNYRGLIPASYPNQLTVGRDALLEAIRRVKLMAREATPVRLVMKTDGLELVAITQDVGQAHEEIDAKYEGAELTVAFNPEYLQKGVEVAPGDEIVISTLDALKPAVLRSTENEDFLYLLMPVRVS